MALRPTLRSVGLLGIGGVLTLVGLAWPPGLWLGLGLDLWWLAAFVVDALRLPPLAAFGAERTTPGRLSHGVQAQVQVVLHSTAEAQLVAIDEPPAALVPPEVLELPRPARIPAGGQATITYEICPRRRGLHTFGPLNLLVQGPLGLATARRVLVPRGVQEVHVYPDLGPLDHGALDPELLLAELGVKRIRQRSEGTEFESLRDAVPEDDQRRIDWRATARRGRPIARNYELERNHEVLLCLDVGRLMGTLDRSTKAQVHQTKLDPAIQTALRLAAVALRNGDRVGLLAFDDRVVAHLRPERDRAQLGRLLEAVHQLEPSSHDARYPWLLGELRQRQKKRALLVFLTDVVDAEASAEVAEVVSVLSRRHPVVFAALRDRHLKEALEAPVEDAVGAHRSLAALSLVESRAVLLEGLRAQGVEVMDVLPEQVTARAISAYLRLRAEGRL